MWWMWGDGRMWGWWGLLMPFMMALVWVPLLLLLAWGARLVFGTGASGMTSAVPPAPSVVEPDARELARRAYARGDLTRERFVQIIEDLDHTEGVPR